MNKLSIDDKRSRISIGIDPAGIGTTGIFLKHIKLNDLYVNIYN